jgi:hypothetical protein
MAKWTLSDGKALALPDGVKQGSRYLADIFSNSGQVPGSDDVVSWEDAYNMLSPKINDTINTETVHPLLSSSLELVIREPIEPMLIITGLFTRVNAAGLHTRVIAGAMGAVTAGDVQESGTYPEVFFQIGGGMQVAHIGKSGIAASFTDEALRYSTWDIMKMNLGLMGKALARHKEQKAVSFLRSLGTELFNNASPATSMFGITTGRGLQGEANGSITMDDVFKGLSFMTDEGFAPDTILVNPLFYYLFIQDPVLRNLAAANGGSMFGSWTGNSGPTDPWSNGAIGAQGPSLGNKLTAPGNAAGAAATGIAGREHGMTSAPILPAYMPWRLNIIVSPFVPFDPDTQLGDIIMCKSGELGFYLVDEEPTQIEWRDEEIEVMKIKIRERYGFAVAHEGQAIGVFKNVKLVRNYWDGTVKFQSLESLEELDMNADLDLG